MSTRRSLLRGGLLALGFLLFFLFGAVAVDPFPAYRAAMEEWMAVSSGHREVFASDEGTRLSTWVFGPLAVARPVVFVHGLGADATYWAGTARALAKAGRTVIVPDGPGSGRSEMPRGPEGLRIPGRVAALDALFRALALEKADLVGHSLGGWTAAAFALARPEKTGRLVLVDSGGFDLPADVEAERRRVLPEDREGGRRILSLLFFRAPFPPAGFVLNAFGRNYGSGVAAATVNALKPEDALAGRERELPHGTVVIWGEREALFPVASGRALAAKIPGARLVLLADAGHDGPLETPREFRAALSRALEEPQGESR